MYHYQKRFKQLIALDEIRVGKVIEIAQFSFIFTILGFIASYIFNKYVVYDFEKNVSLFKLVTVLSLEMALLTIILFYLRKLTLIVPSISGYLFENFKPYSTIDLGMWMTLVFVFTTNINNLTSHIELVSSKFNELL